MKKFLLFLTLIISLNLVAREDNLTIYQVELPDDELSHSIVAFYSAFKQSNMHGMDSVYLAVIRNVDELQEKQKAVWHFMSGLYFLNIDLHDKAANQFTKGVKFGEELELRQLVLYCRNGMASISYSTKSLDRAIEEFTDVLAECEEQDWKLKGMLYGNLAALIFEKSWLHTKVSGKRDSLIKISDEYYISAINTLENKVRTQDLARIYSIYARSLIRDKKYEEARDYLNKASSLSLELKNYYRYSFNLIKWSDYYKSKKQYSKGIDSCRKALRYFKKAENKEMEIYAVNELAYNFANNFQYDSAFAYAIRLDVLKRERGLYKMARQSEQFRIELDVYDKENTIKEQERQIELQAFENELSEAKRKRWLIGGISAIIIIILIAIFLIQNVKQKAKVEKARLIIEEREQAFRSVIEGQERERKRIAQELHDGIGQQLSGIKMALQNMSGAIEKQEKTLDKELTTIIDLVGVSSAEVRHLAHQMLPQVLEEKGLSEALKDLIQSTFQVSKIKFNFEDESKGQMLSEQLKLTIYRSIQELINNTMKHANATEIDLYLYESNRNLLVAYSDNGKGIANSNFKGGLGLSGIKHRIENLKGIFTVELEQSRGFSAILKLPIT